MVDEPGQEINGVSCLLCRARRADAHLVFPLYKLLLLLLLACSDVPTCLSATTIIYIFIRINCSFKNKKLKKEKRKTHNVSKNTARQMHTNYAPRKRKIMYCICLDKYSFIRSFIQARKLNKEDAMDRCKWRKMIKEAR